AAFEVLGDDLHAAYVPARVENLARVDDGIGHRLQVGHVAAFGCGDAEHGQHQPACRVAHVPTDGDGVVFGAEVHRRVAAADVAVTQQTAPAPAQLLGVGLGRIGQLTNVAQHTMYLAINQATAQPFRVVRPPYESAESTSDRHAAMSFRVPPS